MRVKDLEIGGVPKHTPQTVSIASGVATVNWAAGAYQTLVLTEDITTFSSTAVTGIRGLLMIKQGGTVRTISGAGWTGLPWAGGSVPDMSLVGVNAWLFVTVMGDGTNVTYHHSQKKFEKVQTVSYALAASTLVYVPLNSTANEKTTLVDDALHFFAKKRRLRSVVLHRHAESGGTFPGSTTVGLHAAGGSTPIASKSVDVNANSTGFLFDFTEESDVEIDVLEGASISVDPTNNHESITLSIIWDCYEP